MKKLMLLLIPVLLLSACRSVPSGSGSAPTGEIFSGCRALVDGMAALTQDLKIPKYFLAKNPTKQGGEFAVSHYFGVLDHLSMQPGYSLDYVYHYDGMGSYPVLYAYPTGQVPYATEADLTAAGKTPDYLDFIQADDTPGSYFQYVLLSILGGQFYLGWHANYNDTQLVCDKAAVMATVASTDHITGMPMPLAGRVRARFLANVEPRILIGEKTVEVRIVTFTAWGGFFRRTYTLQRLFPHTILDMQKNILLPYDCGVMF
jgi:hypothetical protein